MRNSVSVGTGLYRTSNGGKTWRFTGLKDSERISRVLIHPGSHGTIYAAAAGHLWNANNERGLYQSTDNGTTWEEVGTSFGLKMRPFYFANITVDPKDPQRLYNPSFFLFISTNGGKSFQSLMSTYYRITMHPDLHALWINPNDPKHLMVGSGDGFSVYRDPRDKDIIYSNWQGGNLQRYNERTGETADIKPMPSAAEPKYRFNWNAGVALSPTNKKTLYIGAQFLFKSTDQGRSWTKISPDLTTNDPKKQQQHKSGGLTIDNTTAENLCTIITIS